MKAIGSSFIGRSSDLGPLLLRLGVGVVFAVHGWQKLDNGVGGFADFLETLDVPAPLVVAWLMTIAEGIGGLLLIAGFLTRLVVLPLIAISVGAILLVKVDVGFIVADAPGAELDVALLAGSLALLFLGPGRLSVDGALGLETATAPASRATEPAPATPRGDDDRAH